MPVVTAVGALGVAIAVAVAGHVGSWSTPDRETAAPVKRGHTAVSPSTASSRTVAQRAVPARRAQSVVVPEAPVTARLPSGTRVPVRAVSTKTDGELAVPDNVRWAGWWRGGSRLGDPFGSMLVAAHIDSTSQGLGPYAELLRVRGGQRVLVSSKHLQQQFTIRSLSLVPQGPLADDREIFAADGPQRLTLVTCAPPYDRSRGGYQNLAVVTAEPVGEPVRRAAR